MIVFLTPDYVQPTGGVKVIYDLVRALDTHGLAAAVWHGREGFRCDSLDPTASVPVVHGLRRTLQPGDLLVVPEAGGGARRPLTGSARVVVLNQGHYLAFDGLTVDDAPSDGYPGWDNATAMIATSDAIEQTMRLALPDGFPVHRIPVAVDHDLFQPLPKRRLIAFMTHRRELDLAMLGQILRRGDRLDGWELTPIRDMSPKEVARTLAESALFVSTAERDGFSLPGLEAMASGCLVVGFTGDGAKEYFDDSVGIPLGDTDIVALTRAVTDGMRMFDRDRAAYDAVTARALARARTYTTDRMASTAVDVFSALTGDTGVVQANPASVEHFSLHTPADTFAHDLKVVVRKAGRGLLDAAHRAKARRGQGA